MRTTAFMQYPSAYGCGVLLGFCAMTPALAQSPAQLTMDDYARAETFMPYNTARLVSGVTGRPTWLPDGRFVYRRATAAGSEYVLVDPVHNTRTLGLDQARLASALSTATGATVEPARLPFGSFDLSEEGLVSLELNSQRWACDLQKNVCSKTARADPNGSVSPDGKQIAFVRDHNLWVRIVATEQEIQLTTDGIQDFGYATDNAGWRHSDRAIVRWSPDSKKIATYQLDQRGVGEMYLVRTQVGHPALEAWKYAMPGDKVVPTIQRVIIDVDERRVVRFEMLPDQHRSSHCYDVECNGTLTDAQWSADGRSLAFVSMSRDYKIAHLELADTVTGAVRDILKEQVTTFYESATGSTSAAVNWLYLPATNEFIWYSQRDNWGHLYLYDAATGKLKCQITQGSWNVVDLLRLDEKRRTLYVLGVGRETGNPYFAHLYKVGLDGKHLTLLTPEDATHRVSMSPSGDYFVDSYSKSDVPPITVLRNQQGRLISVLERADITRLLHTGWKPPVPFTVKARDGKTDLYGLLFKPTGLDESRKYPIVNAIYPGPQVGSVQEGLFPGRGTAIIDHQSLAELGFVVVAIDGMGTALRSKSFRDANYGDMSDNTLPDQIAGMQQLARRYAWIDLNRVGIYGVSGGGYATADAMFRYPDFFKVGVSESANHDQRSFTYQWGEAHIGLLDHTAEGNSNYDSQANQSYAENLKGHLLLVHGTLDNNTSPYLTLAVVNALIAANKDFDLLMVPNQRHAPSLVGSAATYVTRRRWDYFVRYLLEAQPPQQFELRPPPDDWRKSVAWWQEE
jgi:dipeptidyl-peptidase 4